MESTIELSVLRKEIHFIKKDSLTTGQQRNSMKISFNGKEWNGLTKYGVFKVEDTVKDVLITNLDIEIPAEVCTLDNLGKVVYFGIKGTYTETISGTETETVYNTPYFRLGVLERGTEISGSITEYPTPNAIDAAIENARRWAVGPSSTDKVPTDTNNAKYWSDQANKAKTAANTAAESVKGSVEAAAKSAQEAGQYAENAKTAVREYPRIDSHGHWERYDPESGKWVDTGALAEFKIRKTYNTITEMNEHWSDSDVFVNDFVMIAGEVEPDNGQLYVKLADSNTKYQYIGDLSGAQGIKGESAYDIAKAGGYDGTKDEFAALLYNAVSNESDRVTAENGRVAAESTRATNEQARIDAEKVRKEEESKRVTAESSRATAEGTRATNEQTRIEAEKVRNEAESNRVTAETSRIEHENTRETNEGARANAETNRNNAEIARNEAETARDSAESLRVQNEIQRQSNETAREVWESYNQDKTYYNGNKVSLNGNSYVCVVESTTNHPGQSNNWLLIAQKGDGLVIKDKYTTIEELRAANPNHTYTYQVEQPNSEFYIYSDIASDWVSIGALGSYTAGTGIEITNGVISATAEVYKAGDGISITNSSISARLGSGLKFDTEKKITLDESAFVEYTDDEITNFYNTVTV